MTTFAVFGMSENWANEEAREHTPTFKSMNGKRVELCVTEWEAEVKIQIAKIMAGKKCVRLSPFFDAPSTLSGSLKWHAAGSSVATSR